jgi:hypothetical protein
MYETYPALIACPKEHGTREAKFEKGTGVTIRVIHWSRMKNILTAAE